MPNSATQQLAARLKEILSDDNTPLDGMAEILESLVNDYPDLTDDQITETMIQVIQELDLADEWQAPIMPDDFARQMKNIFRDHAGDPETAGSEGVYLMMRALRRLGYEEGVRIFDEGKKAIL